MILPLATNPCGVLSRSVGLPVRIRTEPARCKSSAARDRVQQWHADCSKAMRPSRPRHAPVPSLTRYTGIALIPLCYSHRAFGEHFVALLLAMLPSFGIITSAAKPSRAAFSWRTGITGGYRGRPRCSYSPLAGHTPDEIPFRGFRAANDSGYSSGSRQNMPAGPQRFRDGPPRMRERRPPAPLASGVCACVMDWTSMSYNLQSDLLLSVCRCGGNAFHRSMMRRMLVAALPPYQRKGERRCRRTCRSWESC
jgi:hypothetical protein